MSLRTSRNAISSADNRGKKQSGISGVTIAVVLAAFAVVTLTIVQAANAGASSAAQNGIPGLTG